METPQNPTVSDPQLADLLQLHKKDVSLGINCHHIGIIDTFNPLLQTATVKIPYKKTFFKKDPFTDENTPYYVDYPPILDCPVIFLGGGLGSLRFPVKKGDECILLFNDRDIDNWFEGSQSSATASLRLHSFSDAIALVGIRSKASSLKKFSEEKTELRHGEKILWSIGDDGVEFFYNKDEDTAIGLKTGEAGAALQYGDKTTLRAGPEKLKLANEEKNIKVILETFVDKVTELNGKIQSLISAVAEITVTPGSLSGPSSPPLNAAAISAFSAQIGSISTALGTVKTDIGALFE